MLHLVGFISLPNNVSSCLNYEQFVLRRAIAYSFPFLWAAKTSYILHKFSYFFNPSSFPLSQCKSSCILTRLKMQNHCQKLEQVSYQVLINVYTQQNVLIFVFCVFVCLFVCLFNDITCDFKIADKQIRILWLANKDLPYKWSELPNCRSQW